MKTNLVFLRIGKNLHGPVLVRRLAVENHCFTAFIIITAMSTNTTYENS